MKQLPILVMLLMGAVPGGVALAQETKPGRPNANESIEAVFLSTNCAFSVINGFYLTHGSGSVWAAPLGLISGVSSLLYETGVNGGSGFVVATGFVSVIFGIVSLAKVDGKAKGSKPSAAAGLSFAPVSGRASDGRWYGGVSASLRF